MRLRKGFVALAVLLLRTGVGRILVFAHGQEARAAPVRKVGLWVLLMVT